MKANRIEKGIAIMGRPRVYPFEDMQVGDSFFTPGRTGSEMAKAAFAFRRRHPNRRHWKFRCASVVVKGKNGARTWRDEDRRP